MSQLSLHDAPEGSAIHSGGDEEDNAFSTTNDQLQSKGRRLENIGGGVNMKSKMDDPTSPRYAMSGFYIEAGGFMGVAAIDPMRRTCQCGDDMAAEFCRSHRCPHRACSHCQEHGCWSHPHPDAIFPKQLMTIRGTLTVIRVKQPTYDNSWHINGNSCKTTN